ncbi:MAG TPA: RNA polymerase subunit sigma [Planctomycetales bacterium]|jgi:RNA polymerase sigma factor (TIGR02999 family)|nr:RNA polymerase subunit sigma [Planctomycetales bacterium]
MSEVTRILSAIHQGDANAAGQLLPLVYDELRRLAAHKLAVETPGQTLQPTALVHEAYLRLVGDQKFEGRGHFFAAAAESMRRILVENARRKKAVKHGGDFHRVELDDLDVPIRPLPDEIVALDEALTRLTAADPVAAQIVQLHFFAGLSIEQAAETLGVSRATAYRQWSSARAWLRCDIGGEGDAPAW